MEREWLFISLCSCLKSCDKIRIQTGILRENRKWIPERSPTSRTCPLERLGGTLESSWFCLQFRIHSSSGQGESLSDGYPVRVHSNGCDVRSSDHIKILSSWNFFLTSWAVNSMNTFNKVWADSGRTWAKKLESIDISIHVACFTCREGQI